MRVHALTCRAAHAFGKDCATLVYRGVTGHCSRYQRLGVTTAHEGDGVRGNLGTKIERSVIV